MANFVVALSALDSFFRQFSLPRCSRSLRWRKRDGLQADDVEQRNYFISVEVHIRLGHAESNDDSALSHHDHGQIALRDLVPLPGGGNNAEWLKWFLVQLRLQILG